MGGTAYRKLTLELPDDVAVALERAILYATILNRMDGIAYKNDTATRLAAIERMATDYALTALDQVRWASAGSAELDVLEKARFRCNACGHSAGGVRAVGQVALCKVCRAPAAAAR